MTQGKTSRRLTINFNNLYSIIIFCTYSAYIIDGNVTATRSITGDDQSVCRRIIICENGVKCNIPTITSVITINDKITEAITRCRLANDKITSVSDITSDLTIAAKCSPRLYDNITC